MTALRQDGRVRHEVRVSGVVQGVGFRPFVYRLATELQLAGEVSNDTSGVLVAIEGPASHVESFEARLSTEAPPLARVDEISARDVQILGEMVFRITTSRPDGPVRTFVAPDVSVCDDCLRELFDPADRRYRYPFVNCTNCGPRFTITESLPYDRPNTTMAGFELCVECSAEYHDPADRRYHAQPVACAVCGPRISFEHDSESFEGSDEALIATQAALFGGAVIAIKGLGGYHLACDATSDEAVERLRERKVRSRKPFAVMVPDLLTARLVASVSEKEARILAGPAHPIVLLRRFDGAVLSRLVAPGNPDLGLMFPYTPLHHLLFAPVPGSDGTVPRALVMTSGNLSEEPICYDDADARRRLRRLTDAWLVHDRPIHVPCDDSVVRLDGESEMAIRRSRGYAPLPIRLAFDSAPVLAVGGELKNAFCLASGRQAWMSQHIGDMGSTETLAAFERSTEQLEALYEIEPQRLAADPHPAYQTRGWAEAQKESPVFFAQHHHAHIASVMAENGVSNDEKVVGCAFDGTGYGTDGAIWGGELLVCCYESFERAAHLAYVQLPGGDATVKKPYRSALSHLRAAGIGWDGDLAPVAAAVPGELGVLDRQLERDFGCVPTSSMGRLFDAVSSLLGLCQEATYEGEAAIALEAAAIASESCRSYYFTVSRGEMDPAPVIRAIVSDLRRGVGAPAIAAGFHVALAETTAQLAETIASSAGLDRVALSGGVFQNVYLSGLLQKELVRRGLRVLTNHLVPPNDGGLALGQAAIAGGREPRESSS